MTEEEVTAAAVAMRIEALSFDAPVRFYVEGEAAFRLGDKAPEWDADEEEHEALRLASWKILARAALKAAEESK